MKKRLRQQQEEDTSTTTAAGPAAATAAAPQQRSKGFRFGFFGGGAEEDAGPAGTPDDDDDDGTPARAPAAPQQAQQQGPWGREALLLPGDETTGGGGGQAAAAAGQPQRVRILWEESGGRQGLLRVQPLLDDGDAEEEGQPPPTPLRVDPRRLRRMPPDETESETETETEARAATAAAAPPPLAPPPVLLEEHDLVFGAAHAAGPVPPPLGPSLASLLYPVTPARFLSELYGRRALAVHAAGGRARRVVRDLVGASAGGGGPEAARRKKRPRRQGEEAAGAVGLDVAALLEGATRTVVWMRAQDGRQEEETMQYLDEVPAGVAWACHRAGHSLYFSPPLPFQQSYVTPLLRALGMDLGGGEEGGLGGDVEVFAVRGAHATPWHFDAQENITIQLQGCKRWRLRPSGLPDPVTNLHPSSASRRALRRDRALHAACDASSSTPLQPLHAADDAAGAEAATILLRPGSVLYVPSGWWHAVESLGDHPEGSLSINLSLDPDRWAGLLHRSLGPALWGAEALRARARRQGRGLGQRGRGDGGGEKEMDVVAATRAAAGRVLEALRERLASVTPADLLPLAAFGEEDEEEEDDDDEEEGEGERRVVVLVERDDLGAGREGVVELSSDDEEEDEESGGHAAAERRARARGSWQAQAGLSARAGWGGGGGGTAATAASPVVGFARSPLAALVVPRPPLLPQGLAGGGRVACLVHRGYALDPSSSASPAVTVRIETAAAALPALRALAALGPGQQSSIAGLLLGETGQEEVVVVLVRKLVGVLTYHGYLRPASAASLVE